MKPILFNTEMVRAILDGRKTVTRRVACVDIALRPYSLEGCPDGWLFYNVFFKSFDDAVQSPEGVMSICRYRPGDILYVRETWNYGRIDDEGFHDVYKGTRGGESRIYRYVYRAENLDGVPGMKWRPSIYMPKEAARIFLRVTGVRVERLQDITEAGAVAEGVNPSWGDYGLAVYAFSLLWNSTINKVDLPCYGWAANPWVWRIEFEQISKDEAEGT